MLNSKARGKSTAGEMVNLMSVDAQRLMELMAYINSLWSSPLQIAGAIYFLYNTLGISVLAGVGVLILIIPVNMLFGSKWHSLQVTNHLIIYCILYKILPSLLQILLFVKSQRRLLVTEINYGGINWFPVNAENKEKYSLINRIATTEKASLSVTRGRRWCLRHVHPRFSFGSTSSFVM